MSAAGKQPQIDFFVSYTSVDLGWAEWIAWQLEEAGYRVLVQAWDFQPGSNFIEEMQRATTLSAKTLAVVSQAYLGSAWAQREWQARLREDPRGTARALLPVRVDDCEPGGLLGGIVYVDLVNVKEPEARDRLLAGAQNKRVMPSRPPLFPPGSSVPAAEVAPEKPVFPPLTEEHGSGRTDTSTEGAGETTSGKPTSQLRLITLVCGALAIVIVGALILLSSKSDGVVSTDWLDGPTDEPVHYCSGKDLSEADLKNGKKTGLHQRAVDDYTTTFPSAKANFDANSAVANKQREYYLKLIERDSKECDVIFLDVIYMAEFAEKGLLYDMTPYFDAHDRRADFDDQMMKTVTYGGKLWGVPKQQDAGLLYYRTDRARAPSSWRDVYSQARSAGSARYPGLRLQRETNEGLTVVFLELAYAASDGRPIISEDGKTADINEPGVLDALKFMRNAVEDKVIPPTEPGLEGSLDVYERDRALFLRGWPFVAARIRDDAERKGTQRPVRRKTARNTKIVRLPPWRDGGRSFGVLGGHNLVIPRSAGNPAGALHFIDYLTRDGQVRKDERLAAQFPVLKSVAEDEKSLTNKVLVNAIRETNVIPRPHIPNYADISEIIACGVQSALKGPAGEVENTLERIDRDVQRALASKASTTVPKKCSADVPGRQISEDPAQSRSMLKFRPA